MLFKLNLLLAAVLLLAGCSATEPDPGRRETRPHLRYQPQTDHPPEVKYPLRLGVFDVRDRRPTPFYAGRDDFFAETIDDSVSDMIFAEMKSSGLFGEVVRIRESFPQEVEPAALRELASRHRIQMALVADLTKFNMLREKTGMSKIDTFKISVDVRLLAQLVFLGNGMIVWAEDIDRREITLAESGALNQAELGAVGNQAFKAALGDVKVMIMKTGMRMRTQ